MKQTMNNTCRGLQCVSPRKRRKIAKLGAAALHAQGKAHKFTTLTAKKASRLAWSKE